MHVRKYFTKQAEKLPNSGIRNRCQNNGTYDVTVERNKLNYGSKADNGEGAALPIIKWPSGIVIKFRIIFFGKVVAHDRKKSFWRFRKQFNHGYASFKECGCITTSIIHGVNKTQANSTHHFGEQANFKIFINDVFLDEFYLNQVPNYENNKHVNGG